MLQQKLQKTLIAIKRLDLVVQLWIQLSHVALELKHRTVSTEYEYKV